jgi:protein ImuB
MPLSEALVFCPDRLRTAPSGEREGSADRSVLHVAVHRPEEDRAALEQLAVQCERFSPLVGFEPAEWDPASRQAAHGWPAMPSCLYLEITHSGPHFGSELRLVRQLARFLERLGYHVRLGVADTLGAAWAAAHFGSRWAQPLTDADAVSAAPPSLGSSGWLISAGAMRAALQPLPVEALRISFSVTNLLHQLGLFQIGQLAQLPRAGLASRFGSTLLTRWDQALGVRDELLEPYRSAPVFQADWELEHPTPHKPALRAIVQQLVRRLAEQLATKGQGALELVGRLDCLRQHFEEQEEAVASSARQWLGAPASPACSLPFRVGLFQPTASASHLLELLDMQLEQLRLPGPVEYLVLQIPVTARLAAHQPALFPDSVGPVPHQLAQLVDRLASRLGAERIVRPTLCGEDQPERAYAYQTLAEPGSPAARRERQALAVRGPAGPRPLALQRPPLQVAVVAVAPDGPPVRFHFQQQPYSIVKYWGPERIETGWWRGRSVRRDYYRVETERGQRFWLFRQLDDPQWFLHGMYQ